MEFNSVDDEHFQARCFSNCVSEWSSCSYKVFFTIRVAQIVTDTVLFEIAINFSNIFGGWWDVPDHARLPSHVSGERVPQYFVWDEAFPVTKYLMTLSTISCDRQKKKFSTASAVFLT